MAFDNNDPAHLLMLQTEVNDDPVAMGYVPSDTTNVVGLINDPLANTGPGDSTRSLDDVTIPEVSEVIDEAEYAALGEYDKDWTKTFIAQPAGDQDSTTLRPFKGKFLEVFPNGTNTRSNAQALLTVPNSSRAEVLWGWGTVITREDWNKAREYS